MTKITLLDGGMGQELIHRAGDRPTPLWSTQVMMDHPGMVEAVHEDYFRAGSGIATTNTYCIHHDRLVKTGIDGKFEELHEAAVEEAKAARKAAGHGKIAGSIGPLVASYRPDVHPPHDVAVAKYAEVAQKLAPHVDLLFDQGFISFKDNGTLMISKQIDDEVLNLWRIPKALNVGPFTPEQSVYLDFHRKKRFKK